MKNIIKKIKFKNVNTDAKKFITSFSVNYPILSFYIISNFINSILLRLFTIGSFKIRPLFFDLGIVLIFAGISFLIKKKGKNVYWLCVL